MQFRRAEDACSEGDIYTRLASPDSYLWKESFQ